MTPEDFLQNIQNLLGFDLNRLATMDDKETQRRLGPLLRELAVTYLRYSQDDFAVGFRYRFANVEKAYAYLNTMSQNAAWGEDIEARALARILGVNLNVTIHTMAPNATRDNWVDTTTTHNLFTSGKDAPTMMLHNRNNQHWFVNDATGADGNCLFYSMAQAVQNQVKIALQQTKQADRTNALSSDGETDVESSDEEDTGLDDLKQRIGSRTITASLTRIKPNYDTPAAVRKIAAHIVFHASSQTGADNLRNLEILNKYKKSLSEVRTLQDITRILDAACFELKQEGLAVLENRSQNGSISAEEAEQLTSRVLEASTLYAADEALSTITHHKQAQPAPGEGPGDTPEIGVKIGVKSIYNGF